MIFKPSSLHKLFFTYVCPTFYGSPPAAPSNTTSTSTVNQSPWQNPVYQALMLGTADKPGPATSMLNASRDQMAQWNAINAGGLAPAEQASLGTWNPNVAGSTAAYTDNLNAATGQYVPTANPNAVANRNSPIEQSAAQGGLMGLRGYASGGAIDPVQQTVMDLVGRQISDAELADLKKYAAQLNTTPAALMQQYNGPEIAAWKAAPPEKKAAAYKKIVDAGGTLSSAQNTMLSNFNTYKDQIKAGTIKLDESGKPTANIKQGATKAERDAANAAFTKATGIEPTTGKAPYGLMDTMKKIAYFDPTTGKTTNKDFLAIQEEARKLGSPDQYAKGTDAYKKAIAATDALKNYKAKDVKANKLTQYQMEGPDDVKAPTAKTNQMEGPKSWTDQGTAAKYMSPYQQNVTDIQKRESNRDYQKELNNLNAQSVQAGAFGGSRQAIQQSEAARNQAMLLNDIQAKGQQEAYASGMGQFTNEQGQQLTAGQANLSAAQQTTLANQAASIQAMMANQGMDYNTALQNLQAQMGIQGTQAATDLQAALANQSSGLQANQQNVNTAGQLGSLGQGIAAIGTAQNATDLANLGAQGKVAEATQNLGQSYLDAQSGNAQSWLNAPTSINAGSSNLLNAQPIQGGTTTTTGTSAGAHWARGGLIRKGSKK